MLFWQASVLVSPPILSFRHTHCRCNDISHSPHLKAWRRGGRGRKVVSGDSRGRTVFSRSFRNLSCSRPQVNSNLVVDGYLVAQGALQSNGHATFPSITVEVFALSSPPLPVPRPNHNRPLLPSLALSPCGLPRATAVGAHSSVHQPQKLRSHSRIRPHMPDFLLLHVAAVCACCLSVMFFR